MLSLFSVLLVLAASPASAPVPSAEPLAASPLKKIGSTSIKSLCTRIVEHANLAIGNALDDDQTLARLTLRLHTTNFDNLNSLQRRNAVDDLDKQAGGLRFAAAAGMKAANDLRAEAAASDDADRQADLKAFADAISAALARQRKEAADFQAAVTILDGRIDTAEIEGVRHNIDTMMPLMDVRMEMAMNRPSQLEQPPRSFNDYWKPVANDFDERNAAIRADESTAAAHSIGAVKGC